MQTWKQKGGIRREMSVCARECDGFLSDETSACFYCLSALFSSVVI